MTTPTIDLSAYMVGKAILNAPDSPVETLERILNRPADKYEFHRARIIEKGEYVEYVLILDIATRKWETKRLKTINDLLAKETSHVS